MFAGFGCGDRLLRVVVGIAAQGNCMEALVREQSGEVIVKRDLAAVFGVEFRGVEFARRIHGSDPRLMGCVDGRDVRARDPAVADDADVVSLHGKSAFDGIALDA